MMIGYIFAVVLITAGISIGYLECIILIVPLVIDGVVQYKTRYRSNNLKRLMSGMMYGIGLIQLFANVISDIFGE